MVVKDKEQVYEEMKMGYAKASEREGGKHLDVDNPQHGDWVEKMKV